MRPVQKSALVPNSDLTSNTNTKPERKSNMFKLMMLSMVLFALSSDYVAGEDVELPPVKDYGLKDYVYTSKDLPHAEDKPWKLVCRLPYNMQFTCWIKLDSDFEAKLSDQARYASWDGAMKNGYIEMESSNPTAAFTRMHGHERKPRPRHRYRTLKGEQTYEEPQWGKGTGASGEGSIYTIPPGVTVLAVKYRETGYNTEFTGSFRCNDEDYNRLWQKATRTCYLCMRDHFMDCPDRERTEWLGDAVLQMEECFYAFDLASHKIIKKFILSRQFNGLTGQDLIAHGEYGEWGYYMYTGDLETLKFVYPKTKEYLDRYQLGDNGVPVYLKGRWEWYDWGKGEQDKVVIQAAEVYGALAALKKMAEATGNEADLPAIEAKLATIRKNFDQIYWKEDGYRSGKTIDERANAMAVCAGLADRSKWPVIAKLLDVSGEADGGVCGPYFERWVLEALCRMGREDLALLRMYQRYEAQIVANITTLWEYMVRAHEDKDGIHSVGYTTLNHGWNVPNTILSKFIAGLAPETPGWETYHVLPQEAFLTSVAVSATTVKGQVDVAIRKSGSEYAITLGSPSNTMAIVGIPRKAFAQLDEISANGRLVWKGKPAGKIDGLSFLRDEDGYLKFKVSPGEWQFSAKGKLSLSTSKQPSLTVGPDQKKLNKKAWKVSASIDGSPISEGTLRHNHNQEFKVSGKRMHSIVNAASPNVVDGDSWTGWRTMQDQTPGQWFAIDMGQRQSFSSIVLDNTWAIHDSPAGYAVYVTDDPANWGEPVAEGQGSKTGITTIQFERQNARHIKIVQTGEKKQFWSIFEVDVCSP